MEVADRMGYRDTAGRRAVEHFMQDYFRQATRVGELTRIFLTQLEARHAKPTRWPAGRDCAARTRRSSRLMQSTSSTPNTSASFSSSPQQSS